MQANITSTKTKPSIDTIARDCIAVRLRMLNRVVTNIYDDALRPLDLKVSQMNILVATAKMQIARPAVVCDRLQLDVSTLSRNVERMKARGWLEVVAVEDGRAQPFQLTNEGKVLLQKAAPLWKKAQKEAKALLGGGIVELLDKTASRLQDSSA
ncbi:MAG: winged helix-turn-helix transcriptional regulator [Planctomycetes bacterium]|nr:winged helix-turn-helix transcriptional regulator [Planctomycetota bacterium]